MGTVCSAAARTIAATLLSKRPALRAARARGSREPSVPKPISLPDVDNLDELGRIPAQWTNRNKGIVLLCGVGKVSQESGVIVARILRKAWSVRRPPTAESAQGNVA